MMYASTVMRWSRVAPRHGSIYESVWRDGSLVGSLVWLVCSVRRARYSITRRSWSSFFSAWRDAAGRQVSGSGGMGWPRIKQ